MNALFTPDKKVKKDASVYLPSVSIIIPFEPIITSKQAIAILLSNAVDTIERALVENYSAELGKIVMNKLKAIFDGLNYGTHKKSVAIYISPVFEKILYLDFSVKEDISVDEYFSIRKIVYAKEKNTAYNVLLLGENNCSIFCSNGKDFKKTFFQTRHSFFPNTELSNPSLAAKCIFTSFLQHVDAALKRILVAYPAPLFVVGTKKLVDQFKRNSPNVLSVNQFIIGNYESYFPTELQKIIQPFLSNWALVKKQFLLNKLKIASHTGKLVFGLRDVWYEAMQRNGKLLIVQNNYQYPPERGSTEEIIYEATRTYTKFSYLKDVVDEAIEKVLENGGDVEFVEDDFLKDLGPIALIK